MSHQLVELIAQGVAPDPIKRAAAKGALPIPREDLLEAWAILRNDEDPEIRSLSRQNLASVSKNEWLSLLREYPFRKEFFDFVVKVLCRDEQIALIALRNKAIPAVSVEELAKSATTSIIDTIIDIQAKLIENPQIVVALLNNENIIASQVRRIYDLSEQFFRNHPVIPKLLEERFGLKIEVRESQKEEIEETKEEKEVVKEFLEEKEAEKEEIKEVMKEEKEVEEEVEFPQEAFKQELAQEEVKNLYQKILKMSVPKKVELALKGNKEARSILIRDSNKVVQEAVVTSPKITEQEIEAIAKMRNLPEELLRKIAMSPEWMRKYNIVKALATNPKTPLAISMSLIQRFTDLDLKFLMKDKNVSEALRREAKKIYEQRHTAKKLEFKKH